MNRAFAVLAATALVGAAACSDAGSPTGAGTTADLAVVPLAVTQLDATLSGANEVPGPGDPDGYGYFHVKVDPQTEQVCYELTVYNIDSPTAAHIHVGGPGVPGPILIPLTAPTTPIPSGGLQSAGCTRKGRMVLNAIVANPNGYYVNVHNATYPAGAARGQLQ